MSATSDIQSKRSHAEILIAEDSPTQAEKLRYLLEDMAIPSSPCQMAGRPSQKLTDASPP